MPDLFGNHIVFFFPRGGSINEKKTSNGIVVYIVTLVTLSNLPSAAFFSKTAMLCALNVVSSTCIKVQIEKKEIIEA